MKPIGLVLLVGAMLPLASTADAQEAGWRISYTVPRREADELASVFFHTRHVGWAVGAGHTNYTGIYRTADGGQTWERLDIFDGQEHGPDFAAVRFADARHGWIATRTSRFVLRTTDGGETWEPMDVAGVDFVLANRILPMGTNGLLIAADNGLVHRTTNGGNTWETIRLQHDSDQVLDIVRPAPDVLIAVVSQRYGSKASFYRSADGGGTWELISELSVPIGALAFRDANNGVATGNDVAFQTADGGRTWKRTVAAGWRNAVQYVGDVIVGVGENPHVLISRNGGRTWVAGPALPAPAPQQLHDLAVVDPGWWFAPSDRAARLYGFFDPQYDSDMEIGEVVMPRPLRGVSENGQLPAGAYRASLRHAGYDHALVLRLSEPAQGATATDYSCSPCEAVMPVDLEYYEHDDSASPAASGEGNSFSVALEPSEDGVAIVIDTRILPPLSAVPFLAAIGVDPDTEVNVGASSDNSGGFLGRMKKAVQGDVRGAVAGASPRAAADRVNAAAAEQASSPVLYRARLRYNLPLVPPGS